MSTATLYRGSVVTHGFVIDTALVDEATARERILRCSPPHAQVWRYQTFLILRFAAPKRCIVEQAPGAPLLRRGNIWSTTPAAAQGASFAETLQLLVGGVVQQVPWTALTREEPASWLDLSEFVVLSRVAEAVPVAVSPVVPAPPAPLDVADAFGVARAAEASTVAAALRRGEIPGAAGTGTGASEADASSDAPPPSSWWQRMRKKVAGAVWNSPAGDLVAKQHARYLERTMRMFDEGKLDQALHHAIALGNNAPEEAGRIRLGMLQPRQNLHLSHRSGGGSVVPTGNDLVAQLRAKYRAAFDKLAAAGDIDRAAFVLAELLGEAQEAVSFLERHQRLVMAAKLAEARKLPDGVLIRQWFIAGDRARAIAIARRTGAFADAVSRLDTTDRVAATALRLLWADHLANVGDFVGAVTVIWAIPNARELAAAWIRCGIDVGGVAGAQLLARAIAVDALPYPELTNRVVALLAARHNSRVQFVHELCRLPATESSRAIARLTLRAVLATPCDATQATIESLATATGDAVLRSDLRGASAAARELAFTLLMARSEIFTVERSTLDGSPVNICDAVPLPDGNVLLALGELGIRIVTAAGHVVFRSSEPAHHLVLSDFGDRAILLAPRGGAWRLTRLALITKSIEPWCDARFTSWAASYDGDVWWIGADDGVYAIDALVPTWTALWHVRSENVEVGPMVRQLGNISIWLRSETSEIWTYDERTYRLGSRHAVEITEFVASAVDREAAFGWQPRPDLPSQPCMYLAGTWHILDVPATGPSPMATTADWLVISEVTAQQAVVSLLSIRDRRVRATVVLGGATRAAFRIFDNRLLVCDNRGRVIILLLGAGEITHDLRIEL